MKRLRGIVGIGGMSGGGTGVVAIILMEMGINLVIVMQE
jgi:hypothetical protein